jgi:toxin ParE1/3/4
MLSVVIVWLPEASTEKDELLDYIAERNVLAALGVDDQMRRQVDQLVEFPFLGRKGRIPDTFELVISRTPYIVAYRLYKDEAQILHVFHERRDWPLKH